MKEDIIPVFSDRSAPKCQSLFDVFVTGVKFKKKNNILYAFVFLTLLFPLNVVCVKYSEYAEQTDYCALLKHALLPQYLRIHHRWPDSLDDINRDLESSIYDSYSLPARDRDLCISTFSKYRPVMVIVEKEGLYINIQVTFTKGRYYRGIFDLHTP